ncbi:Methyltransferase type 11 [Penicillium brevicompactum]
MSTASEHKEPTTLPQPNQQFGFSGVNWSEYIKFRPIYPASFFQKIFAYHSQKSKATWTTAHDVGAGCGIVSASLAPHFNNVVVSDPNEGYTTLARKLLVEESRFPSSKLRFLQESAENSSLEPGSVDLIAACECIHWTIPDVAIKGFARELRPGGTLMISLYTRPYIVNNDRAHRAWKALFSFYADQVKSPLLDHAVRILNSGTESWGYPEEDWESVKRVYLNAEGTLDTFKMNGLAAESQVKEGEEIVWEENVEDWMDEQDVEWFKGYAATWSKPDVEEDKVKPLWDELEQALGGKKARIATPVALAFATRKP